MNKKIEHVAYPNGDYSNREIEFLRKCGYKSDRTIDNGVLATYSEGISNSIMEYMALRKPVVATNGGGINELVLHGKTGFLVDSNDAHELSKRIEQLLADEELANRMGSAGCERIKRKFSLEKMTNLYVELYERLLNV